MADYATLADAMDANDELAEARMRYRLLAETFEAEPKLRSQLNPSLERVKDEILRLSALAADDKGAATTEAAAGRVVAFDACRFKKTG